jgi:geranylgeranyl transferase type-2 subunit beta
MEKALPHPGGRRTITNMNKRLGLILTLLATAALLSPAWSGPPEENTAPTSKEVLAGLRGFFTKTAQPDGSFRPGLDPDYKGMSDTAYSDLAAPTYAVVLHRTFGWKLPDEAKTRAFFLSRQGKDGAFVNVKGTADPKSAQARLYNTTQGLVALHALGVKPPHDPLPVLEDVLQGAYKAMPAYTTSFFPLAYQAAGRPFPREADRKIRALLVQAADGYLDNHIAATFHAAHYYRLLQEATPRADAILKRVLHDQKADGGWLLNPPARDRHAAFDAVFVLRQLGGGRDDCKQAIARAARWALTCRNDDGGFGHYPGSPSDADAVYFQVGTLVMAGFLRPAEPLPADPHLLGWGHLMPLP